MARRGVFTKGDDSGIKFKDLSKERIFNGLKIFRFVKPYRWHLVGGLFLLFLSALLFMSFPFFLGAMVDVAQGESTFGLTLQQIGYILIVVVISMGAMAYFRVLLFMTVSEKATADVRRAIYQKLITLSVVFYENSNSSELISRVTADVEKLYSIFSMTLAQFLRQIIILIIGVVFLSVTTPRLALVMLVTVPVIIIGAMFFGKHISRLSKKRQKAMADSNTILGESVQNIDIVKSFTNEWFEFNRYDGALANTVKIALKYARGRAMFIFFIMILMFGSIFFIFWKGAMMVMEGELSAGQLISFVFYTGMIANAIAGLGNLVTEMMGAIGATERVREILDKSGEVTLQPPNQTNPIPLDGNIKYENVHFSYPTRPDLEVLNGIDIEISQGQKIALVGASGAGKSTIVQVLLKFYPLNSGRIIIDGKDIKEMEMTAFRQNFAIVPQEVLLFGGSIRENISYGDPTATEEEIIEAARQSHSWDFIQSFPDGLDTIVGERGVKLSGGQRQRIAIARAILKNPSILILDEATSSLDSKSEEIVQAALNNLMQGRTSIIIAHRLSTIKDADKIYVIDNGQIVEEGTHESLSEMGMGVYSSLARLQK